MCRWFAYISPEEPCLLADVIINPANALSKQCSEHYLPRLLPHGEERDLEDAPDKLLTMRNSLLNMDGLGLAWYTSASESYIKSTVGLRPALYKSQSPPLNDFNLRSLCNNTETKCVLAHIRASSGSVVTQVNCHPFVFGRHAFMHNGAVSSFTEVRRDLLQLMSYDAYSNVLGSTDSEHVAALYMTFLTGDGTRDTWEKEYNTKKMRDALMQTVITILQLQHKSLGSKAAPNSLNLCTTDGKKMVAIRFRNHDTEQPPSLYWSEYAGRTLNRKYSKHPDGNKENVEATKNSDEGGKHTIIASEPTTYDESEWDLIGKNCSFMVDEHGTETEEPINYDAALNAFDSMAP